VVHEGRASFGKKKEMISVNVLRILSSPYDVNANPNWIFDVCSIDPHKVIAINRRYDCDNCFGNLIFDSGAVVETLVDYTALVILIEEAKK